MTPSFRADDLLAETQAVLEQAGIDTRADAELLLAHVLQVSRGEAITHALMGKHLNEAQADQFRELVSERSRRVPLQHLIGTAPFRTLELSVGPGVFVPRPETEIVAQFAIDALCAVAHPRPIAVDLCTGSGALALSIAAEVPMAEIWAVEKSPLALAWAERNVERFGDNRVTLVAADVRDAATELSELAGSVDVLVTNPPYVPTDMVPVDPEVAEHDPEMALYSGSDGLDLIRVISDVALTLVTPGGMIICEHAETQGAQVREIFSSRGWRASATHPDLTRRDRLTTAIR